MVIRSTVLPRQPHDLILPGRSHAVTDPSSISAGASTDAPTRPIEISRDLRDREITPTSDLDHITLELRGELLRHDDILSARLRATNAMSTKLTADPTRTHRVAVHRCQSVHLARGRAVPSESPLWTSPIASISLHMVAPASSSCPLGLKLVVAEEQQFFDRGDSRGLARYDDRAERCLETLLLAS
jgi:hypothetical protein